MNYFYSDGNSGVMGPYSKEEIVEFFREKIISLNAIVCVEGTQTWFGVRTLLTSADLVAQGNTSHEQSGGRQQQAPVSSSKVTRWANAAQANSYLESIRQNSCYSTLRSVITIGTILAFIVLLLFAAGIVAGASEVPEGAAGYAIGASIGIAILGSVCIIASRQAALLLVDLVDSQLEKNARM